MIQHGEGVVAHYWGHEVPVTHPRYKYLRPRPAQCSSLIAIALNLCDVELARTVIAAFTNDATSLTAFTRECGDAKHTLSLLLLLLLFFFFVSF